jgi:pyrrolidone-carboxylate peptidase
MSLGKMVLGSVLMCLGVSGCIPPKEGSDTKTVLGGKGNDRVARMFHDYAKARSDGRLTGCSPVGNSTHRVLIQGFAPFQGLERNISGQVVQAMMQPAFWPAKNSLNAPRSLSLPPTPNGIPNENGVTVAQRTLEYNGVEYEVCFVLVQVQWDFAAAVTVFEAERFNPGVVLMSGVGGIPDMAQIESAALNHAAPAPGFDSRGRAYPDGEAPVEEKLLVGPGVQQQIAMTWNPVEVQTAIAPALAELGRHSGLSFTSRISPTADPSNDYICNNISFVLLHAANNVRLRLVGGKIDLQPVFAKPFRSGFFHYPHEAGGSSEAIIGWAHVMMGVAGAVVGQ